MRTSWASCLVTLLLGIGVASAQSVVIGNRTHASYFDNNTLDFNVVGQELKIIGTVAGINPLNVGNYTLFVQGMATAILVNGNLMTYSQWVPVGPDPSWRLGNTWPGWYPYVQSFMDRTRILKPFIVELYDTVQKRVVARTRIVMFDKRYMSTLEHQSTRDKLERSAAHEISQSGLDALQPAHLGTMPQVNLASFNSILSNRFSGFRPPAMEMPTNLGAADRVCIAINNADPAFRNSATYAAVYAEALTAYAAYQAAKQFLDAAAAGTLAFPPSALALALAQAAVNNACVKEPPKPDEFEVCFRTLNGVSRTLRLDGINNSDLQIGSSVTEQHLQSKSVLGRLDGTVDATLSNIFIRYNKNPGQFPPCTPRPSVNMSSSEVAGSAALRAATLCTGLQVDAGSANMANWLDYKMEADPSDSEKVRFQAAAPPVPIFTLLNKQKDPDQGACANPLIRPYALSHLEQYWARFSSALDATWNLGNPNTQEARSLSFLFSRWQTGIFGDRPDYTLDHTFQKGDLLAQPLNRLAAFLGSDVTVRPRFSAGPTSPWVYPPPGPFPCLSPQRICAADRNVYGQPFDVSYTVTTGALNQVLRELSASDWLMFEYRPSYADLGIPPKSGANPNAPATLDGPTLSYVNPAFADLGNTRVRITLRPTIVPFTYIDPDPPQPPPPAPVIQDGDAPLTYQLGQYQMDFIGNAPGPNGTNLWLRAVIDFHDPEFQLDLDPDPTRNLLQAEYGLMKQMRITIVNSQFVNCGLAPRTLPPGTGIFPTCGSQLEADVLGMIQTTLQDRLLGMLARYAAPEFYDAGGRTTTPKAVNQTRKFQWEQVITFYGNLP
ncbi:MAG: hypothetical protein JNN08_18905 [Bryobacterales bacterium]|nr:hypothetical protein [Bryobacterales bacterium]